MPLDENWPAALQISRTDNRLTPIICGRALSPQYCLIWPQLGKVHEWHPSGRNQVLVGDADKILHKFGDLFVDSKSRKWLPACIFLHLALLRLSNFASISI